MCLATPQEVLARPEIAAKVASVEPTGAPRPVMARAELMRLLAG